MNEYPANRQNEYQSTWSRGGLLFPSEELSDLVAKGLAIFDAVSDTICKSDALSQKAGI